MDETAQVNGTTSRPGGLRPHRGRPRRRWWTAALAAAAAVPMLVATGAPSATAATRRASHTVTITRDASGVAHVKASSFTALGYGEAWAFSEDNFCTLANDFVTVEGERSKYFGPNGLSIDYSAGAAESNLDSDLFWQSIKKTGIVTRELHDAPPIGPLPQVLQVYRGFVAGYNAYLRSGKLNDPSCAHKAWAKPITLTDMVLRGIQIATEASSAQFIAGEVSATPPSSAAAPAAPAAPKLASLASSLGENGSSTLGSNGIAVGKADTRSGDGMVLANPHFPWRGTERFWMAQLTVPGRYNVEGGTLFGFPLIGIGFNQDLAWTHTVSTDFRFTFYQLKLVPGHPTSYYVDGKVHHMGVETVRVQNGKGTTTHRFYTTIWGRVLVVPQAGYTWSKTTAYAIDDSTMNAFFRAANEYYEMGRATSVENLLAVESKYLAIPTFNTIAADKTGHVLYADVGNTPAVTKSLIAHCTPKGLPQLVYAAAGVVTLNGSRLACRWLHEKNTPVPGIFNASHLPHTIRTDYVENSNDSYWLANPHRPFHAFSPIIGRVDVVQGLRTRLGNEMIAARVAGTDHLGPAKFSLATMQKMWEGDTSMLAKLVLKPLVKTCKATPTAKASNGTVVKLAPACKALAGYNGTGRLGAKGGWLFSLWGALAPSGNFWARPFDAAHPLTTPSGLKTSNPAILSALASAVVNLRDHHVPLDASYGQVQYLARRGHKIPIPGCDTGCFNAIYANSGLSKSPLDANPYGEVFDGSSLVMTTELTSSGPVSQGILTYSQATNPRSPYYDNMTKLYSEHKWVDLPYTAAQLAADQGEKTITLTAP